ncbi:MAG: septum formation protein Maf [Clostridia bacterium]|nr:septum formation protein Maf [Clostridia bacterium]
MEIILASASPRRRELLPKTGVTFRVIPSDCEERADTSLPPHLYAEEIARQKAEAVAALSPGIILGADTIVIRDGEILGKPSSVEDAKATLRSLSGRSHVVITGFCVIYGTCHRNVLLGYDESTVYFNDLSDRLIEEYVATGKCMDKAGSYGVQDGFPIVKRVEGSLDNVIGLPVEKLTGIFKEIEDGKYEDRR